jgi:hypothetical protein
MPRRSVLPIPLLALAAAATVPLGASADPQVVTVQASGDLGPFPALASGFLHGLDEQGALDAAAVAPLEPAFWRLGKTVTYDLAAGFEPAITYGLGSTYAWAHGGFPYARPWEDWAEWEQYVAQRVLALRFAYPDDRPAYYDVWNEPDLAYFWSGTYEQLLELHARTIAVVKGLHPEAKLVGPSVAKYVLRGLGARDVVQFARDLEQAHGVRLDALSWHENDSGVFGDAADKPEDIADHVADIRASLAAYFPDYSPELHVNEYAGNRVHLSPGYNVGYLFYLIDEEVDWASRACWTVWSGTPGHLWSDCWSGLDGLFLDDGFTPQIVYWVTEAAVRMRGGTRLPTASPNLRTNVLASRLDAAEEIRILVGRHEQSNPRDVVVRVEGWPWADATARVEAGRIPHFPELFDDPPRAIPWPDGPIDRWSATLPVTGGTVEVSLDAFVPNDAWSVVLTRDSGTGVAGGRDPAQEAGLAILEARPNPFAAGTELRFSIPHAAGVRLDVYDVTGRRVARLVDEPRSAGRHGVVWRGEVPAGIYFARLAVGDRVVTRKLVRER